MMQFGLSTFGGVAAGLVLATGAAVSEANASAHNEVTRLFSGSAGATASASGYVRRVANNYPVTLLASAIAAGASVAEYRPLPVEVTGTATIEATQATAFYSAYGDGLAYATTYGGAVRRIKVYPYRAECFANGEADGQLWQMAYPEPGIATAIGFGTTYHVGHGNAQGIASLFAQPKMQIGVYGQALCEAFGEASALFQIGVSGTGLCVSDANGDPAVTVAGIRYFEVNADAYATAEAFAGTVGIHQAQTGWCSAYATGEARYQIGGKGIGLAVATGWSDAMGMGTGAAAVAGLSNSTATAWATLKSNAYSVGTAVATGLADGLVKQTKVYPAVAVVTATAVAALGALKYKISAGNASTAATTQVLTNVQSVQLGVTSATASAVPAIAYYALYPKTALALAVAQATVKRTHFAGGEALAVAQGLGSNNVNDLVRAPVERTYYEPQASRLVIVGVEPRTITV